MRCILLLGALALTLACADENEPTTSITTAGTTSGTGGQPCTGNEGEVSGVAWLTEPGGAGGAEPAPDTELSFYPARGTPFVVRTDAEGAYSARLPADHYDVQGSLGKCVYPPLDVTVEACKATELDVMLELCLGN